MMFDFKSLLILIAKLSSFCEFTMKLHVFLVTNCPSSLGVSQSLGPGGIYDSSNEFWLLGASLGRHPFGHA